MKYKTDVLTFFQSNIDVIVSRQKVIENVRGIVSSINLLHPFTTFNFELLYFDNFSSRSSSHAVR